MSRHATPGKVLLLLVTIFAALTPVFGWSNGENSSYSKGDMLGSAGIGIYHLGVFAAFDYGIHDCISAGAAVGFNSYSKQVGIRVNQVPLMVRAAFHPFNLAVLADKIIIRDMVDVYVGLSTGWVFRWQKTEYINAPNDTHPGLGLREYIGLRYHFTDKLGLFVEDCGEIATIALGVTYKF